jgi:hypothetical protein
MNFQSKCTAGSEQTFLEVADGLMCCFCGFLIKHNAMKAYGEVDIYLLEFLNLALYPHAEISYCPVDRRSASL